MHYQAKFKNIQEPHFIGTFSLNCFSLISLKLQYACLILILNLTYMYKGHPESKDCLRLTLPQVNELHHFEVNVPQ
jgi:hypothetical protein